MPGRDAAGRVPRPARAVAWQAPCTLQHGQRLAGRVEPLLEAAGYVLTPMAGATLCCGSAGTYSLLQPELSRELKRRKLEALLGGNPVAIATGNIGCLTQLRVHLERLGAGVRVRHTMQVLRDAIG